MNGIELTGVKTHNLRNLNVRIPYQSLTVITGVSGSGKSSLAFDTLYAEGQRRYVESISAYARQFLERMEKPPIEAIHGILPSIAIEAKNIITNARSTVGTQTELSDYLRLLFARIGKTYCYECGEEVKTNSAESVAQDLLKKNGKQIKIGFVINAESRKKSHLKSVLEEYVRQGFLQMEIDGIGFDLSKDKFPKDIQRVFVVVDTVQTTPENKTRLVESLETAFKYGHGDVRIDYGSEKRSFSNRFSCANCNLPYQIPSPNLFSFNSPLGACTDCQGFGRIITLDWNLIIPDHQKSILEGVIEPWTKPSASWEFKQLKEFCRKRKISVEKPFQNLSVQEQKIILEGEAGSDYFSVKDYFKYLEKKTYKMHVRIFLSKYRGFEPCSKCSSSRLKKEALCVKVHEKNIWDLNRMTIEDLRQHFTKLELSEHEKDIAGPVLLEIRNRLRFLDEVGLGYLTLERASRTLSGGEAQRINLATSLGSALVDTLYVLDEPSIGLHERDNQLLIRLLHELRDLGNTVVIVEHDRSLIESADWVIDLGPKGGEKGGEIMFSGSFKDLLKSPGSLTGKYFRKELLLEREKSKDEIKSKDIIQIVGATHHNLKNVSVKLPLHQLTVITGVSGSGKSTLVYDVLYANYLRARGRAVSEVGSVKKIDGFSRISDIVLIDQSPIGRTSRSNPATYLKAYDEIRKVFSRSHDAKRKGLGPGHFSFNVRGGRCEKCEGEGILRVEMHFLADVSMICDQCGGSRFQSSVLAIRYKGKNIQEVLEMTVDEAILHFKDENNIVARLTVLSQMGLGYLRLGQSATTLSGGEAQRMKLACEMTRYAQENLLYVFDEPTTGLHYADIAYLLAAFDRLLARGHSLCIIEHNMEIIKCADYVIDLGPEGGTKGGGLVYQGGLTNEFLNHSISFTGKHLKQYLARLN